MILRSIVSALLPADYREQVLGDLQERGFRLTDVATAVPQVWWSHFLRGRSPRFALAQAPDLILHQRTEQLFRRSSWLVFLWILIQSQSLIALIHGSLEVSLAAEAVLFILSLSARYATLRLLEPLATAERSQWTEFHNSQLQLHRIWARLGMPHILFALAALSVGQSFRPDATTRSQRLLWLLAAFAISLILGHIRARRLQRELDGLA
jgi:uncharacterized membrane protein YbjE (DUF340 family)